MLTSTTSATSTSALTSSTSSSTTSTDSTESQDRFLKLLVAQLNNQDPMNPMDNAQMTSQMAQINTVTGIQQVNETLQSMAEQFASLQVMQGTAMVGHEVLMEGNVLTPSGGVAGAAIDLAGPADSVKIDILSPGGQVLESFNLGALEAGRQSFDWDASSYTGSGNPSYRVTATLGGQAVATTSMVRDTVVSVGSQSGAMHIELLGRQAVTYDSIKAVL